MKILLNLIQKYRLAYKLIMYFLQDVITVKFLNDPVLISLFISYDTATTHVYHGNFLKIILITYFHHLHFDLL